MPVPSRLYLDTNVLVSAVLKSDPEWQRVHQGDVRRDAQVIETSRKILLADYLYKLKPKTSVYAIGEFISKGRTEKFGKKTFEEMYKLVSKEIFTRCEVINAELHQQGLPKIDSIWEKYWMFAKIHCNAETIDRRNNQPAGVKDLQFLLALTETGVYPMMGGGVGPPIDLKNVKIVKLNSIECSAPAFEILLFTKASEIANEYNIHLQDAIHVLYAQGNAEYIITNDSKFCKQWEVNPEFRAKSGLEVKSAVSVFQWCKDHGWL